MSLLCTTNMNILAFFEICLLCIVTIVCGASDGTSSEDTLPTLFIAVTSAPDHGHLRNTARKSWLTPCNNVTRCVYRFFIDSIALSLDLQEEIATHKDIVIRNECKLMVARHPNGNINYGNSPPAGSNVNDQLPDYLYRRMYKIDWKVCFLHWFKENHDTKSMTLYAFVEDDSYTCTRHLLHQTNLLKNLDKSYYFRTGTRLYDGFDDSSTLISAAAAELFMSHYLEEGFDCHEVIDAYNAHDNVTLNKYMWLSWGNSWASGVGCNWSRVIQQLYNIQVIKPLASCFDALQVHKYHKFDKNNITLAFPCSTRPLIFHHPHAGDILLSKNETKPDYLSHLCEYVLFVDKVKEPHVMLTLWNSTDSASNVYRNYTEVFINDEGDGWVNIINDYNKLNGLYTQDRKLQGTNNQRRDQYLEYFYDKILND